jgi:hypothetical protein
MSIYRRNKNHRKIYEQHFGSIPKEPNGRTYEVHHLDGDPNNNDPTNLVTVTLQDHFDIHFSQGDFRACSLLGIRLKLGAAEIKLLRKRAADSLRDKTIHKLINVDGSIFIGTREEFLNKYPNVHDGNLCKIINKKLPSTQGWRMSGEPVPVRHSFQSDTTIHNFIHKDGRTFTGDRHELLNSQPEFQMGIKGADINIGRLINNKNGVKSVKGWRLL